MSTDTHVIESEAEALAIARDLAADFAREASRRDRERLLPTDEIERFSRSGLWGITVPRAFGGAEVSHRTLAEVTAIISEADPSIGQIPQNHYCLVDAVRLIGSPQQQAFFFSEVLDGKRFGNAVSERGVKDRRDLRTRLSRVGDGLRLDGTKFYSTGALFAHWVPVAAKDDEGLGVMVYVRRDAPGLTVADDWTGIGQRTTASGTVTAENVAIEPWQVLPRHRLFDPATIHGPFRTDPARRDRSRHRPGCAGGPAFLGAGARTPLGRQRPRGSEPGSPDAHQDRRTPDSPTCGRGH